jgi:nucleoid-associated protein YgaU
VRAALWIAVLVAAFVLAWRIQERWSLERREERDAAYARPSETDAPLPDGFSRVVIGQPSGAPAVEPPPGSRARTGSASSTHADGGTDPRSGSAGDHAAQTGQVRRYVVVAGDSLSEICSVAYGTARKDVVEAVARANGLTDPGAIRVGQHLVLPPLAELSSPPR